MPAVLHIRTHWRKTDLYFIFIGIATLGYGLLAVRRSRNWALSDWLINYQGGFVRRGLPGQLAYALGRQLHLSPVVPVVLFVLILYVVFLLSVRNLVENCSRQPWTLAVLLSPATLSFQLLDSAAGFRKEIIFLAAFSLFVALLRGSRLSPAGATLFMLAALPIAILSHESLICFAPYFFAAFVINGCTLAQAAGRCAIPFGAGIVTAWFCAHYSGDLDTATRICASLGYKLLPDGNEVCSGGAIAYLGFAPATARRETLMLLHQDHYVGVYLPLALLALAPLVAGSISLARAGHGREVGLVWCTAGLSFLGSLILFLYALDWGRWIYIHIVSIAILLFCLDGQRREDRAPAFRLGRIGTAMVVIAYATLWTLPHAALPGTAPVARFGYVGLLLRADHGYRERHLQPQPSLPGS